MRKVCAFGYGTDVYRPRSDGSGFATFYWITLMKLPSVSLYKETLSKNSQVPAGKSAGSRTRFGMAEAKVWARTDLTPAAKVVLMGIAIHGEGESVVALSQGYLAGACGIERSTVALSLDSLEAAGLLKKSGGVVKQVQPYEVLYPLIVTVKRKEARDTRAVTRRPKTVSLVECLECHHDCRPNKAGWCKTCAKRIETNRNIDQRIERAFMAKSG